MVHETKESSLQTSSTDSSLAQLAEHETDDQEVVSSNPTQRILRGEEIQAAIWPYVPCLWVSSLTQ